MSRLSARRAKKAPGILGSQGGRGHLVFRERLDGIEPTGRSLCFEADDGFPAERSLRGPQSASTPDADSTTWLNSLLFLQFLFDEASC